MVQLETCLDWFVGFGKWGEGMIGALTRNVFSEFSHVLSWRDGDKVIRIQIPKT